jgi:hypothetical protein
MSPPTGTRCRPGTVLRLGSGRRAGDVVRLSLAASLVRAGAATPGPARHRRLDARHHPGSAQRRLLRRRRRAPAPGGRYPAGRAVHALGPAGPARSAPPVAARKPGRRCRLRLPAPRPAQRPPDSDRATSRPGPATVGSRPRRPRPPSSWLPAWVCSCSWPGLRPVTLRRPQMRS